MGVRAFSPLSYFPQVDRVSRLVESACLTYLNDVDEDPTVVPDMDLNEKVRRSIFEYFHLYP